MNRYSFWALLFRQKYIKRWGLMRNLTSESLSEHSTEVAFTAHALALIGNRYFGKNYNADRAATLALFHDAPEVYTGDLPTPVKYFDEKSKDSYAAIEHRAIDELLSKLPNELVSDYRNIFEDKDTELHKLVKAADKLCAYIKCLEEEKCGNTDFKNAAKTTLASLEATDCPELKWFMDNVLPSFELTIDQIQL